MAVMWPDHLLAMGEWADLLPDPGHHVELVDGVLLVTPRPALMHQRVRARLAVAVEDQLPGGYCAVADAEVVIAPVKVGSTEPATVRVPDVIVVRSEVVADNPPRLPVAEVLLAVEIVSPGTRTTDRITKLVEYAAAGIPAYWLVDLAPATASLTAYILVDGDYEVVAEVDGVVELVEPFRLRLDLRDLTRLH